jgi:hypothetical protein
MDGANKSAVMEAADYWGKTAVAASKIRLMTEYCTINKGARLVKFLSGNGGEQIWLLFLVREGAYLFS